jgi:hypothetical protein
MPSGVIIQLTPVSPEVSGFTGLFVPELRSMRALAILSASAKGSELVWSRSICLFGIDAASTSCSFQSSGIDPVESLLQFMRIRNA